MAEMLSPLQIKRLYSGSLDADYTFETLEEMQEYVASPTSYPGQILYSVEDDKLYKIKADLSGVDEVGGSEGGFVEVESSADLPNPPENKIFYTQPKPEEVPDFSSLWVQSGSSYKMQFFLDNTKTDVKFVFDDDSFIDWGLPLKDGWELSGSQYKYNYNGKTTPQAYPAAIIQTVSWFKEDGSTVQKTVMTLWMNTPRTFTLTSDLQLYYMLPIDQGNKITVSPLLSQYRDMYNEMHPLDSSWTAHKVKYDSTTRVLTNQTSYSHSAQFIIEMPEPATLPLPQVWARDIELATKEYVDELSGLPEPEGVDKILLSLEDEEGNLEWSQVDKSEVDFLPTPEDENKMLVSTLNEDDELEWNQVDVDDLKAVEEVTELPTELKDKVYVTVEAEPEPYKYSSNTVQWIESSAYIDDVTGENAPYITLGFSGITGTLTYEDELGNKIEFDSADVPSWGTPDSLAGYKIYYKNMINGGRRITSYPAMRCSIPESSGKLGLMIFLPPGDKPRFNITSSYSVGLSTRIGMNKYITLPDYIHYVYFGNTTHDATQSFEYSTLRYNATNRQLLNYNVDSTADVNLLMFDDYDIREPQPEFVTQVFAKNVELLTSAGFGEYDKETIESWFDLTPEEAEQIYNIINDSAISLHYLWSSSKVNEEIIACLQDAKLYSEELIGKLANIELEVVSSLPDEGEKNKIYILIGVEKNVLYIWKEAEGTYIDVGDFEPNLDGYLKTEDLGTELAKYVETDPIDFTTI